MSGSLERHQLKTELRELEQRLAAVAMVFLADDVVVGEITREVGRKAVTRRNEVVRRLEILELAEGLEAAGKIAAATRNPKPNRHTICELVNGSCRICGSEE